MAESENGKNGKHRNGRRSKSVNGNGHNGNTQDSTTATLERWQPDPDDIDSLTFRQRLFALAFFGEAKGNITQAARIAGFAHPHVSGHRLFRDVRVKALIDQQLNDAALSAEETLARLSEQALGLAPQFWTEEGALDFPAIRKAGKTHLIKKVTPTKAGRAYELADPQQALVTLAKYRGLLVERVQVSVNVTEYDDPAQLAAIERGEDPGPPRKRSSQVQPALEGPTVIETTGTVIEPEKPDV